MAMQKRIRVQHDDVFPAGAAVKGVAEPVWDFDRSTKDNRVQAVDVNKNGEGSGDLMWQVVVIDFDAEAGKKDTTVTVKIAAKVQPVPPKNDTPFPLIPVEFVGMVATPYVEESNGRSRIAWSYRAEGMVAPGQSRKAAADKGAA